MIYDEKTRKTPLLSDRQLVLAIRQPSENDEAAVGGHQADVSFSNELFTQQLELVVVHAEVESIRPDEHVGVLVTHVADLFDTNVRLADSRGRSSRPGGTRACLPTCLANVGRARDKGGPGLGTALWPRDTISASVALSLTSSRLGANERFVLLKSQSSR